jgi:hypothetical protein
MNRQEILNKTAEVREEIRDLQREAHIQYADGDMNAYRAMSDHMRTLRQEEKRLMEAYQALPGPTEVDENFAEESKIYKALDQARVEGDLEKQERLQELLREVQHEGSRLMKQHADMVFRPHTEEDDQEFEDRSEITEALIARIKAQQEG